LQKLVSPCEQR